MIWGYQAVYDNDMADAIEYASANRFDYVSFDLNIPRFYVDHLGNSDLDRIREHANRKRVGLAFHAPGDNISLFSDYPAIRKSILEHFGTIIAAAERLGARHVTLHTGAYPAFKQAGKKEDDFIIEYEDYFASVLYKNLMHLGNQTRNVLLCVENFHFTALTMKIVRQALGDSDRLFLTWDIAKTYDSELRLDSQVEDFMWNHAARIREVHAHDVIRGFRQHQIVGDGAIDFKKYAPLFQRPDVAVTLEVRPREAATLSRDRLAAVL